MSKKTSLRIFLSCDKSFFYFKHIVKKDEEKMLTTILLPIYFTNLYTKNLTKNPSII